MIYINNPIKIYKGQLVIPRQQFGSKQPQIIKKNIDINPALIELVKKKLNRNLDFKKSKDNIEKGRQLYEVILKPKLQESIDAGILIWDEINVQVRGAKSKRFAGFVTLSKVDIQEVEKHKDIASELNPKALYDIIGQMQLQQISEKIEELSRKIDFIRRYQENKTNSKLIGIMRVMEDISESDVITDFMKGRINGCIQELHGLIDFFKKMAEDSFKEDADVIGIEALVEAVKESFFIISKETNKKYNQNVNDILKGISCSLQGYILSSGALIKCYEMMGENQNSNKHKMIFSNEICKFNKKSAEKITFLLRNKDISIEESKNLEIVIEKNIGYDDYKFKDNLCELKNALIMQDDKNIDQFTAVKESEIILELYADDLLEEE